MIKTDQRITNYLPKLSDDEYNRLEKSVLKYGIRNPLVLWNDILIDGKYRLQIAEKHNLKYQTISYDFDNINEVFEWIDENQLSRRNAPLIQKSYLRSRLNEKDPFKEQFDLVIEASSDKLADKILAGDISIKKTDIEKLSEKGEDEIYRVLEPIMQDRTNDYAKSRRISHKAKKREFKEHEIQFAKEYAKSRDRKTSYLNSHKHIVKVTASKYNQNLEWLQLVINEWVAAPYDEVTHKVSSFCNEYSKKHNTTPLGAYSQYVDSTPIGNPVTIIERLLELHYFVQLIDNVHMERKLVEVLSMNYKKWQKNKIGSINEMKVCNVIEGVR